VYISITWYIPVQWFLKWTKRSYSIFTQNQDTIVIKQTEGGKSLCYTIVAILSQGITVVFSPLKVLIDDQVMELIKAEIPCGSLYTLTE